jgi:hypothetical protein
VRKKVELLKGCSEGNSDTARCRKGACKGKRKIKKKIETYEREKKKRGRGGNKRKSRDEKHTRQVSPMGLDRQVPRERAVSSK